MRIDFSSHDPSEVSLDEQDTPSHLRWVRAALIGAMIPFAILFISRFFHLGAP
jgi:hypothetical protein